VSNLSPSGEVAIIGLSGRFPGAGNLEQYWTNLKAGVESIRFFSDEELSASGIPEEDRLGPYVPAKGVLDGTLEFDAEAFEFNRRDARLMDPQFRVFLETAHEALENAGHCREDQCRIGVFAGAGANTYQEYLRQRKDVLTAAGLSQAAALNQTDFLSGWVAYKLNLTGPAVTVQTACSTSLAAIHLAAQSLLSGECDVAIAGGVSISFPQIVGYQFVPGGLYSSDGHCRAFDAQASGFVPGDGAGAVVMRRLADARASGDFIRAVVKGSAMTNDGSRKSSFMAPSQEGIFATVVESLAVAAVSARSIGLLEAHGGATALGDPIEMAGLNQAFRTQTDDRHFCALGSVKSNIGHTNAAAGVASLIKAVLAIENRIIPPAVNFRTPHPLSKLEQSPFYIPLEARPWLGEAGPRRAAVNSFGIGGTNVHVVLEEAPARPESSPPTVEQLLIISARTATALERATAALAHHIEGNNSLSLADAAFSLATGRREFEYRTAVVCTDRTGAVEALRGHRARDLFKNVADSEAEHFETPHTEPPLARTDLLRLLGDHWTKGSTVDWRDFYVPEVHKLIPLPTYPFERRTYNILDESIHGEETNEQARTVRAPYVEPRNNLETVVSSVWAFHLGLERVGLHDSFFDIGGNSLAATRIVATLRETLGVDLPLRSLLENATVLKLSQTMEESAREWDVDVHEIARLVREVQTVNSV